MYLVRNQYQIYRLRIRVPKRLQSIFKRTEINKSLHTKSYRDAVVLSSLMLNLYKRIELVSQLGVDSKQLMTLVDEFYCELGLTNKAPVSSTALTHEYCYGKFCTYYSSLDIDEAKRKTMLNFLKNVFLELIDPTTVITSVDFEQMLFLKEQLAHFPKRTIQKYKTYTVKQLLKLDVELNDRVSTGTLQFYINSIKRFYNYCKAQRYIEVNPTDFITIRSETTQDSERDSFSSYEVKKLLELIDDEDDSRRDIYHCLIYSGLRSSELWKAKLCQDETTGVWFFDLTDKNLKLKTLNSHRIVPLHSELVSLGIPQRLTKSLQVYTQDNLQKRFNNKIKTQVTNSSKKVLYSLRHTVATELKYKGVEPLVISELLGHSTGKGMTLGRYASRYPLEVLKGAIDKLSFTSSVNNEIKIKD